MDAPRMKAIIRDFFWRRIGDPFVRSIENRLKHYKSLESDRFTISNPYATIDQTVVFMPGASLTVFPACRTAEEIRCSIQSHAYIRGELVVGPAGSLKIGEFSYLGPGSRIWARHKIEIGRNVLMSHYVDIHDSNSHSVNWAARREEAQSLFRDSVVPEEKYVISAPVVICDDVWIGFKASILKGVNVGARSIVAAGSVVTKDVPPDTLVAGNPARIIRSLV